MNPVLTWSEVILDMHQVFMGNGHYTKDEHALIKAYSLHHLRSKGISNKSEFNTAKIV